MQWVICFSQQWISILPKSRSPLPFWMAQEYLISWWANPLGNGQAACAVTRVAVGVTGNQWVATISLAVNPAQHHHPCDTARGSLRKLTMYIFGCQCRFGSEGGREKAQIYRRKAVFHVLATFPVLLLTFPEDLFHMLNNVLLHHHNRDSQPKGLKD